MSKEITKMIIIYERAFKDMRKKIIKSLKSNKVSVSDLMFLKRDFNKFCEIYNNLIYFKANSFEVN